MIGGTKNSREFILISEKEYITLNAGYLLVKPDDSEKVVGGLVVTNNSGPKSGKIVGIGPRLPMQGVHHLGDICYFTSTGAVPLEFRGVTLFVVPFSSILVSIRVPANQGRPKKDDADKTMRELQQSEGYKRKMAFYADSKQAKDERAKRLKKIDQ